MSRSRLGTQAGFSSLTVTTTSPSTSSSRSSSPTADGTSATTSSRWASTCRPPCCCRCFVGRRALSRWTYHAEARSMTAAMRLEQRRLSSRWNRRGASKRAASRSFTHPSRSPTAAPSVRVAGRQQPRRMPPPARDRHAQLHSTTTAISGRCARGPPARCPGPPSAARSPPPGQPRCGPPAARGTPRRSAAPSRRLRWCRRPRARRADKHRPHLGVQHRGAVRPGPRLPAADPRDLRGEQRAALQQRQPFDVGPAYPAYLAEERRESRAPSTRTSAGANARKCSSAADVGSRDHVR